MGNHFNETIKPMKNQSISHSSPGSYSNSNVPKAILRLSSNRRALVLPVQDTLPFT